MTKEGRIASTAGRRHGGKKIDTWEFFHPAAETVKVDVSIHSGANGLTFSATAQNGPAAGKVWEGSDIEALRDNTEQELTAAALSASDTKWVPSLLVELVPERARNGDYGTGFRIGIERLKANGSVRPSNDGETEVIRGNRLSKVVQRSIGEERPDDIICGMRAETQHSAAILAETPENAAQIEHLCRTLDVFARLLGQRLGPDRIGSGIPSDDELVRLMREAADSPR